MAKRKVRLSLICPLCQKHTESPVIDHDHATGQMRDWLCRPCNLGLGHFKDDVATLRRAAEYIDMHKRVPVIEYLRYNANEFHRSRARRARKKLEQEQATVGVK